MADVIDLAAELRRRDDEFMEQKGPTRAAMGALFEEIWTDKPDMFASFIDIVIGDAIKDPSARVTYLKAVVEQLLWFHKTREMLLTPPDAPGEC